MGQEILYCHKCGKRLVGDDFTRGRAHTFNHRQYCTKCLPQEHSGVHRAQPDRSARSGSGRTTRIKLKPATTRATPAAAPRKTNPLILVAAGFLVAMVGVVYVILTSGSPAPPPEPVAARPAPVAKPPSPPAGPSKEKLAQELKDVEAKVQKLVDVEQFGAALDLLEEAKKRYAVPEWEQSIGRKSRELMVLPAGLFPSLKQRATAARVRGALAEEQQERARVATWGRKDLLDDFDQAMAAIVPREPLPAGAKVLVQFPLIPGAKYRNYGNLKNGSLVSIPSFGVMAVGWESGKEIFKVPQEGEVRVSYSTTSSKKITVVLRSPNVEGKSAAFNFWVDKVEPGRPQLLKFPLARLQSWGKDPIIPGNIVDNVYIQQDDKEAVLTVYDFVILQTKP